MPLATILGPKATNCLSVRRLGTPGRPDPAEHSAGLLGPYASCGELRHLLRETPPRPELDRSTGGAARGRGRGRRPPPPAPCRPSQPSSRTPTREEPTTTPRPQVLADLAEPA